MNCTKVKYAQVGDQKQGTVDFTLRSKRKAKLKKVMKQVKRYSAL